MVVETPRLPGVGEEEEEEEDSGSSRSSSRSSSDDSSSAAGEGANSDEEGVREGRYVMSRSVCRGGVDCEMQYMSTCHVLLCMNMCCMKM